MIWLSPPPAVHATMKSALSSLTSERERLRQCVDYETCPPTSPQVVGLKNTLATVRGPGHTLDTALAVWRADVPFPVAAGGTAGHFSPWSAIQKETPLKWMEWIITA